MKKLLLTLILSLAFSGLTFAQHESHWNTFDDGPYEDVDYIVAFVKVDGSFITESSSNWTDLEVASYVNGEVRGHAFLDDYTGDGVPYPSFELPVYYTTSNETVSFKLYDHGTATEFDFGTCNYDITTAGAEHYEIYNFDFDNAVVFSFTTPGPSAPTPWENEWSSVPTIGEDVTIDGDDVVIGDGVVAYANSINLQNGGTLTILDGGQLICNTPVDATVIKNISSAKAGNDTWYTISSPVDSPALSTVTNLVTSTTTGFDYAMFLYDEPSHHWMNQKLAANASLFNTLTNGRGYLYWNNGENLEFNGTLNIGDVTYPISYTDGLTAIELKGFNLIGNPFPHNIYKGTGAAINSEYLTEGYYVLDNNYEWQVKAFGDPIKPTQGIIVEATQAFNLTITDTDAAATAKRGTTGFIELSVSNGSRNDVTYALFSDKAGLTKINRLNAETPMIYFQRENGNFAIATIDNEVKDLAVNFEAGTTGTYDLKVRTDAQFDYLHLIDNMTGNDIDLLATPSYSFDARTTDYASRFRLVFSSNTTSLGEDFGFISNGNLVIPNIEGEATLQVIDVIGRVLSSETFSGCYNKAVNASAGVYMIRLIQGNDVRTQKIVVR